MNTKSVILQIFMFYLYSRLVSSTRAKICTVRGGCHGHYTHIHARDMVLFKPVGTIVTAKMNMSG